MFKKTLIIAVLVALLLVNWAVLAMAARPEADGSTASPIETRQPAGGVQLWLTPIVGTNGDCQIPGSSSCPPATPGG